MTTKQEKDSFDPLAWMNEDEVAVEEEPKTEVDNEVEGKVATDEVLSDKNIEELNSAVGAEPVIEGVNSKITLDATLNIQNVTGLYDQFVKQLETQNVIEIDASSVVSIDTATLQLLTVLKQTGINLQKEIVIDFPSDEFVESAELLGLSELLEVDQAAAGFF